MPLDNSTDQNFLIWWKDRSSCGDTWVTLDEQKSLASKLLVKHQHPNPLKKSSLKLHETYVVNQGKK